MGFCFVKGFFIDLLIESILICILDAVWVFNRVGIAVMR